MNGNDEDEDEAEVFRRAMQDVRPLKLVRRAESSARPGARA
jgi:DNA-nicking Smr family endonuclease